MESCPHILLYLIAMPSVIWKLWLWPGQIDETFVLYVYCVQRRTLRRAFESSIHHLSTFCLFVPFLVVLCNFACFCQPKIIQKQSTVYQLHLLICWEEADNRLWSIFDLVGGGTKLLPWSKSSWFMSHFWLFYLIHILLGNTSVTCMFDVCWKLSLVTNA